MNVNNGGYIPSDNNIAVGPNHIVEVVNAAYAVYRQDGGYAVDPGSTRQPVEKPRQLHVFSEQRRYCGSVRSRRGPVDHHAVRQPVQSLFRVYRGFADQRSRYHRL